MEALNSSKRDLLKTMLREGVLDVLFVKKDGTERKLKCTLRSDLLPTNDSVDDSTKTRKENTEVLQVYDLENDGWRSFRLDSIIAFSQNRDNE